MRIAYRAIGWLHNFRFNLINKDVEFLYIYDEAGDRLPRIIIGEQEGEIAIYLDAEFGEFKTSEKTEELMTWYYDGTWLGEEREYRLLKRKDAG